MTAFVPLSEIVRNALNGAPLAMSEFSDAAIAGQTFRSIASNLSLDQKDVGLLSDLLGRMQAGAEPQMALNNFDRFIAVTPEKDQVRQMLKLQPAVRNLLITLFSGSQFLSDVLVHQPESFSWLADHETLNSPRDPQYYRRRAGEAVAGLHDPVEMRAALSHWRRRELLRIGCRDLLLLADAEDVSRDISDLAQAIVDLAANHVFDQLARRFGLPVPEAGMSSDSPAGTKPKSDLTLPRGLAAPNAMCVLGMGKLGGRELNFSSDIDLVFVYDAEGETTGRNESGRQVGMISNHMFFTRMGEGIVKFLAERGPEGNLFRVDMRLRPEGSNGPLARSIESFVNYLSDQARDWERIAYLKARVLSGSAHLAERLYRVMSEFVYNGIDAKRIVAEVQELKVRIDREVLQSDLYHREVKRGYGGIREIEFVIAAMQIIHGNTHHALRVRNTFLAIQRLREVRILTDSDAQFYQMAYSFLRQVEHRLQMAQERQTHTLPTAGPEYESLARRCGFADGTEFHDEYVRITGEVHRRFSAFFENDLEAVELAARDVILILDREADPAQAQAALARRGLASREALRMIHTLAYGTSEVFVSAEGQRSFEQMLPALLRMIAAAPFPQKALAHLHSFAVAMKGITYYYEVIASHPDILKLLVTLFGSSDQYSEALIAHPEFFDALISTRILQESGPGDPLRRERLNTAVGKRFTNRSLVMLRRAAMFERLLIALQLLLHIHPVQNCVKALSETADICLEIGMRVTAHRLAERIDPAPDAVLTNAAAIMRSLESSFSVVALGKYGGHELNFGGDLDVIFVYDDSGSLSDPVLKLDLSMPEFYALTADTLTAVLSDTMQDGKVFTLDARLRPHGRGAPIATAISQFQRYLETEAEVWEFQAMQRARSAWGHETPGWLNAGMSAGISRFDAETIREEILSMRLRLEKSVSEGADRVEFKRSPGGLIDLEFLIQYLALTERLGRFATQGNYFEIQEALKPVLDRGESETFERSYQSLRLLENIVRLVTGGTESSFPISGPQTDGIAKIHGMLNGETLIDSLKSTMKETRQIFESVVQADLRKL